jgi:hypothetical protein
VRTQLYEGKLPEWWLDLLEHIARGETLDEACAAFGTTPRRIHVLKRSSQVFKLRYERALRDAAELAARKEQRRDQEAEAA